MRDKQTPGDTYNHKEHVYADPVALRLEIERDKQEEEERRKKAEEEKRRAAVPPPVPSGPREPTTRNVMYAELEKKTNIQGSPIRVRELGSRFGGTIPRPRRSQQKDDDAVPPPVPAVTESRNILESPPVSPSGPLPSGSVPNENTVEPAPENELNIPAEEVKDQVQNISDDNVDILSPGGNASAHDMTVHNITEEPPKSSSPMLVNESEVVIDVKINSEIGFDIGAEIPAFNVHDASDNNCGIKLVKNVKRDAFAIDSSDTVRGEESFSPPVNSTANKTEQGTETGSVASSSDSSAKRKTKDVESGMTSVGHLRRNLIIVSLFLLILLILISAVIVFLLGVSSSSN